MELAEGAFYFPSFFFIIIIFFPLYSGKSFQQVGECNKLNKFRDGGLAHMETSGVGWEF